MGNSRAPLALWGGIECTVNRVGDTYYDQIVQGGHDNRLSDLDRCAELGIKTLRYPILWERTAPDGLESADWSWADERLGRLRELGIRPIVGLVHHGSGPRGTSLVDPQFPEKHAAYARAVAERYPWVDAYTPINEPLTTARFSGLYGHWYPHGRDGATFARALLTQCRAVLQAMEAIREVNPRAELVQTEDMGRTHSTPVLAYQAEFENERRWLSFDLLCGRVTPHHPMGRYLRWLGIGAHELEWFTEHFSPPDTVGVNYYVTSERFLDERRAHYPPETHGGNGRHEYADVEAVRVDGVERAGVAALLHEAWARYRRPVAITEAHLGCDVDEQMRWLWDVWQGARAARRRGADVRAVTAWALFGAYDWDSLLTRWDGCYEPGAFDVRDGTPHPTPLANMARALATQGTHDHPALSTPGWWHHPTRLIYPPFEERELICA